MDVDEVRDVDDGADAGGAPMAVDGVLQTLNEKGAPALTAAGAVARHLAEGEFGATLVTLSASLVGSRAAKAGVKRETVHELVDSALAAAAAHGADALALQARRLAALAFEVVDAREGRGERELFAWLFLRLHATAPAAVGGLLRLIPHYSCWKTVGVVYETAQADAAGLPPSDAAGRARLTSLQRGIVSLWARQLVRDDAARKAIAAATAAAAAVPAAGTDAAASPAPSDAAAATTQVAGGDAAASAAAASSSAAAAAAPTPTRQQPRVSLAGKWAPRIGKAVDRDTGLGRALAAAVDALRQKPAAAGTATTNAASSSSSAAAETAPADDAADVESDDDAASWLPEWVSLAAPAAPAAAADAAPAAAAPAEAPSSSSSSTAAPAAAPAGSAPRRLKFDAQPPQQRAVEAHYRALLSALTAHLDTVEARMCARDWAGIVPEHVPSRANRVYHRALTNELPARRRWKRYPGGKDKGKRGGVDTSKAAVDADGRAAAGNKRSLEPDRVAGAARVEAAALASLVAAQEGRAAKRIKGGRNQAHELVGIYAPEHTDEGQRGGGGGGRGGGGVSAPAAPLPLVEAMWADLIGGLKAAGGLTHCVALSDVSGSMAGLPMLVSYALGIATAQAQPAGSPWAGRVLTFESQPQWVNLADAPSLWDAVNIIKRAPWGGSTNFGAALRLLLDTCLQQRVPPAEAPRRLLVFSDMQFDEAAGMRYNRYGVRGAAEADEAAREQAAAAPFVYSGVDVRVAFREAGYEPPAIVFWNLRAGTNNFQAETTTPGVALLSGFSQDALKEFAETGGAVVAAPAADAGADAGAAAGEASSSAAGAAPAATADARNAWETLRDKLDGERYARVGQALDAAGARWTAALADALPALAAAGGK